MTTITQKRKTYGDELRESGACSDRLDFIMSGKQSNGSVPEGAIAEQDDHVDIQEVQARADAKRLPQRSAT